MVMLDVDVDIDDDVSIDDFLGICLFICLFGWFGSHIQTQSMNQCMYCSSENQNQLCKLLSGTPFYGSNV